MRNLKKLKISPSNKAHNLKIYKKKWMKIIWLIFSAQRKQQQKRKKAKLI